MIVDLPCRKLQLPTWKTPTSDQQNKRIGNTMIHQKLLSIPQGLTITTRTENHDSIHTHSFHSITLNIWSQGTWTSTSIAPLFCPAPHPITDPRDKQPLHKIKGRDTPYRLAYSDIRQTNNLSASRRARKGRGQTLEPYSGASSHASIKTPLHHEQVLTNPAPPHLPGDAQSPKQRRDSVPPCQ